MSRDAVRWGILGTAAINAKLLAGARLSPEVEVVAVASRTADRAARYAAAQGIPRAHGSYDELLADPQVDAVYISVPNALHHPWTLRALQAGKHVLCEKPYSPRPEDVEAAFDTAERAGLVLSEAFMWRHHPQVGRLREIVAELGELQTIRATFSFVQHGATDVRLRPDLDGGSLLDVGCYCVSGARLLAAEEPDAAYGVSVVGPTGVDLRFTGLLHFPSGVIAEFTSGFTADHRGLEAVGTAGSVLATDPWQSQPAAILLRGEEISFPEADPYQLELEDVNAAIRGERPPLLGREDALGQARTLAALRRSAEEGRPVRP